VSSGYACSFSFIGLYLDGIGIHKRTESVQDIDSVFFHQEVNPADCLLNDFGLPSNHTFEIEFQLSSADSVRFELRGCLVKMF
jgi:hypothetical protein